MNTLLVLSYEFDAERPVLSISKFSQSIVADETYHLDFIQKPVGNQPDGNNRASSNLQIKLSL